MVETFSARALLNRAEALRQSRDGLLNIMFKSDVSAADHAYAERELANTERALTATEKQIANLQSFRASTKRIETSTEVGSSRRSSCKAKPVSCHPALVDAQELAWPSTRPSRRADTKPAIGKEPSDELQPPGQRLLRPARNARPASFFLMSSMNHSQTMTSMNM
jgi:hypothetical protein